MTKGVIGLFASKRGAFCTLVVVLAFALVLTGQLDGAAWADFTKWIAAILVTGHTISGTTETITRKTAQPPPGVSS